MSAGATLDAGALIAVDRGDRRMGLMLKRIVDVGGRVTIPSTVLGQVVRNPRRQVRLMRLVRHETTDVMVLDVPAAVRVGRLLARSGTKDIADAHVADCAQRTHQPIMTSDPNDLRVVDPTVPLIAV